MQELEGSKFQVVQSLLEPLAHCLPLRGVITGRHAGRIFVDDAARPAVALTWTPWGYYYLAGDASNPAQRRALAEALTQTLIPASVAQGERGLLLTTDTADWEAALPALLGQPHYAKIFRRTFNFDPEAFEPRRSWREQVPEGFVMRRFNTELAQRQAHEILTTWRSIDEFLARGMGYALLHGDAVVSACIAAFAVDGKMEIGVSTDEGYRCRGLGTLTSAALIDACLAEGLTPKWECFWDNQPSLRLAEKLGFRAQGDYPIYYWEVNA